MKHRRKRPKTTLKVNKGIIGDSIEITIERLMQGEGIEGIEDRDLVYNDDETSRVNPLTNIRADKMELMLEEKIDEHNFKNKKAPTTIEEEINEVNEDIIED